MITTLTPLEIIATYPSALWVKSASTRIKIVDESDCEKESHFFDIEGRRHEVRLGRCICVGAQGERWSCSVESLNRDRVAISEEDADGYRQYQMRDPKPLRCFDIPMPFILSLPGGSVWQCPDACGGIVTWDGGLTVEMRIIARDVFLATYSLYKAVSQRDTQFADSAKLLLDELLATSDVWIETDELHWRTEWKKLIAQYAYDLAIHACRSFGNQFLESDWRVTVESIVCTIPDMVAWPEEGK